MAKKASYGKSANYGEIIRSNRVRRGLTQRELGDLVGVTDGYIAHCERMVKLPSVELCQAIAGAFEFTPEELDEFLEAVDEVRAERSQARIRTRGLAIRGQLRTLPGEPTDERPEKIDARSIARDLADNPKLETGYRYLKRALADPRKRDAVLTTLEALAKSR